MRKPILILLLTVALIGALIAVEYHREPGESAAFTPVSFEEGQRRAARAEPKRLLVVEFTAPSCEPCRRMDREVWSDPTLVRWMRDRGVAVRIDFDADKGRARMFGVQTIPSVVLLDGTRVLDKIEGPRSAQEVLDWLNSAAGKAGAPASAAPASGTGAASAPADGPSPSP